MDDVRKNSVPSSNQTVESVICNNAADGNVRILFIGNSITYHTRKDDLGWYNSCGMAASCPEKDYVHRLIDMLYEKGIKAEKCVVNVADWERNYKEGNTVLESGVYKNAVDFNADIIILRFLENCSPDNWDGAVFKNQVLSLMNYFNASKKAKFVLSTSFWRHIGSEVMKEIADEYDLPCIQLSDLGDRDEMKAIGKFKHEGVAMHPGDWGMQAIAERLLPAILNEIRR